VASVSRRLSTVIITQDQVRQLERCIRSCLPFSNEVVVVDSGSSDGSQDAARRLGCKVVSNPWPGYAAQKNFGAHAASHDWIFSIDSDEYADDTLRRAIEDLLLSPEDARYAYSLRRVNGFMGAWLTESPERIVRLYDRRRASFTPSLVHEVVDVPLAEAPCLEGSLWHENHTDLEDATRRLNLYTSLEAEREAAKRGPSVWRLVLRPIMRFGHRYVLQRSARHGWRGLFFALHWAYWELMREMKVFERRLGDHRRPGRDR